MDGAVKNNVPSKMMSGTDGGSSGAAGGEQGGVSPTSLYLKEK